MQMFASIPWLQPLLGGVLIGLASWLLLASLGKIAGISGIAAAAVAGQASSGWRWAFLAGLLTGGACFSGLLSTPMIVQRPALLLVIAGLLVGFGTVIGSGCTSGHGVCGLGRRSMRSLAATLTFMGAAMLTVFIFDATK